MNIGIDIDNTVTCSIETMLEYKDIFKRDYLKDKNFEGCFMEYINGSITNPIVCSFYHDYCLEMAKKFKLKEDAKEIIDKLHNEGNKIIFITARSDKNYINAYKYCADYFKNNNVYFDKIIVAQEDKLQACIDEHIDIIIDDSITICEKVQKNNITSLVFNSIVNRGKTTYLPRANSWKEVYKFIENCKKN